MVIRPTPLGTLALVLPYWFVIHVTDQDVLVLPVFFLFH
jgi:hypothetical protein